MEALPSYQHGFLEWVLLYIKRYQSLVCLNPGVDDRVDARDESHMGWVWVTTPIYRGFSLLSCCFKERVLLFIISSWVEVPHFHPGSIHFNRHMLHSWSCLLFHIYFMHGVDDPGIMSTFIISFVQFTESI